jgi:serine/threonine-protein kinase
MVTNDLGACEWFVWDLRRSSLIDRGQLDQLVSEFLKRNPRAEAPALAEYLVKQGSLTGFQAERILNGKSAGLVLGPYVLLDAIGQGSMGQVFKASSKNDAGEYAVKVLPRRSMWNVRLARRQVRSFGQFSHEAVVPFVDVGTAGGLHYLVWPLAEGQTLEAMVQQNGRLSGEQAAMIGVQIAQGIHSAHTNGIFHGLVKPSNVMVGSDGQARLLDFGIGSLLVENEGESLVDTMSTANTLTSGLDCTSPESVMDPTNRTPAGDQYSLGCTLYFCLTGRVPFPEGSAVEKMMAHQTKQPTPVREFAPECQDGFEVVIDRLMAKKPEDRYQGMDEVVEALEPYLGELAGAVAAAPAMAAVGSGSRRGLSSGGMTGLPPAPAGRSGGGSRFAPPAQTPPPARPTRPTAAPARFVAPQPTTPAPAASPIPPRSIVPGRANMQHFQPDEPEMADEIELTPASPKGRPKAFDPSRVSASWIGGEPSEGKKSPIGMIGLIAAAAVLAGLVFLGVKLLVLDK